MAVRKQHSPLRALRRRLYRLEERGIRLRGRLLRQLKNRERRSTPVFLIGCGRSGTTMLLFQLGKAWQVETYNENHPELFRNFRLHDFDLIESVVERSFAPIVLLKPILDTYRSRQLFARFPAGKAIFIYRHYYDVINSSLKRFGTMNRISHVRAWMHDDFAEFAAAPPPVETREFIRSLWRETLAPEAGAALFWLFQNRLFFDLGLDRDARVRLLQYESIVAEPAQAFPDLCKFLGFPPDRRVGKGVFANAVGRDSAPALPDDIERACRQMWEQLNEHLRSNGTP